MIAPHTYRAKSPFSCVRVLRKECDEHSARAVIRFLATIVRRVNAMEREMAISHHPRWFTLPYKVTDRKSKRQARIGALPGMPNQLRKVDDQTIVSRRMAAIVGSLCCVAPLEAVK